MVTFKTISLAAATCGLTPLTGSVVAHAQGPTAATGSIDIYNTDFQMRFTS